MAGMSLTASISGIPHDVWLNVVRIATKDCGDDVKEALKRVEPLLLPVAWTWDRFDQEYQAYQARAEFPSMWSNFEDLAAPSPEAMRVAKHLLCGLSPAAVSMLIFFRCLATNAKPRVVWAAEAKERLHLDDSALYPVVKELGNHKMAFATSCEDLLSEMKVEELKNTAIQLGIQPLQEGKADIVNRILQFEDREAIRKAIPADRLSPSFKLKLTTSEEVAGAFEWERNRIELLCHTLSREMAADRDIRDLQSAGLRFGEVSGCGDSDCGFCRQHFGKRKTLASRDALPPYHIGCRCSVLGSQKDVLLAASGREPATKTPEFIFGTVGKRATSADAGRESIAYSQLLGGDSPGSCAACKSLNEFHWIPSFENPPRVPNPLCTSPKGCRCMIVGTSRLETGAKEVAAFIRRMGGSATAVQVEEFQDSLERAAEAESRKAHEASDKAGRARAMEKTQPTEAVKLYRESIAIHAKIAKKSRDPWIWRDFPYLYNRLTQLLERLHEYGESLTAVLEFEALPCADKGTKSDREAIAKRKERLLHKSGGAA